MPRAKILVVDDDPSILQIFATALREDGYEAWIAGSGGAARTEVAERRFDLIVLDLMLPDTDGLLLCSDFARLGVPVLVCSGTLRQRDGALALRLGAEAVVSKPVDLEELSARVARILATTQRRDVAAQHGTQANVGNLRMDRRRLGVQVAEAQVEITPTEFRLLFALAKASGQVLTRSKLSSAAWGYDDASDGGTIDVHIGRLRTKLGSAAANVDIVAVRGEGYKLLSQPAYLEDAA